jgi:hypothetical protein
MARGLVREALRRSQYGEVTAGSATAFSTGGENANMQGLNLLDRIEPARSLQRLTARTGQASEL